MSVRCEFQRHLGTHESVQAPLGVPWGSAVQVQEGAEHQEMPRSSVVLRLRCGALALLVT